MKSVLITGGSGSFGQAYAEHLLKKTDAERIVIYSRGEHAQEQMAHRLGNGRIRYFIGDVRDHSRLVLAMRGIETVVHAAALKIVPTAEYNPTECIATNIRGAENVVRAAIASSVKRCLALSTDKAVNPLNLYGASKLCAEKIFLAANNLAAGGTTFSVVRYGNVVGSRGSVVPLFQKIAQEGGSLPITDVRMTRFWITMEQAINLVNRACKEMKGREIYVPKIPSVNIVALAESISTHWHISGIRPGEKLHEALISEDEMPYTTIRKGYFVIRPHDRPGRGGPAYTSNGNEDFLNLEQLQEMWNENKGQDPARDH